jgi:hypothetical protein
MYELCIIFAEAPEDKILYRPCLYITVMSIRGHYATSWKIAGSSLDVVDFFNLPNPYSRIMALGSIQPLTEMSTRNLPGGKGRPVGA